MNWEAIGAIAELLGSVAVVITLVFLTIQIRSNSAMVRNAVLQSQADSISEWSSNLAGNPELYDVFRRGLTKDPDLTRNELGRFDLVLAQAFQSVGARQLQYLSGGMDEKTWIANLETIGPLLKLPGGFESWNRQKHTLDGLFQIEVETYFAEAISRHTNSDDANRFG